MPLHSWEWAAKPWVFLIAVYAHGKWPDVLPTVSAKKSVELLRNEFARYGLPEHLHSDNGSQITSEVFRKHESMKANNIRHTFSASYHPATNGQVERFVQTFKQAMRSATCYSGAVKRHLAKFLFAYRNAPHATTGDSPAMLLMGRGLRTRLDVIRPNTRKTVENHQPTSIEKRATQRIRSWRQSSGKKLSQRLKYHPREEGQYKKVLYGRGTVTRASDITMVPSAVDVPVVNESQEQQSKQKKTGRQFQCRHR